MKDRAKKSAKDNADELLRGILEEMATHSNLGAWLLLLAHAERGVQRRVLDALDTRLVGRPSNPISDEEWLAGFETWRDHVLEYQPDATDLEVIEDWIRKTGTRYGRTDGEKFHPTRQKGRDEIKRIRDVIVRAKRSRKNPSN